MSFCYFPLGGNSLPFGNTLLITVADCAPAKRVLLVPVPRYQTCIGTCIRALDRMPDIQYLAHPFAIPFGVDGTLDIGAHTFNLRRGAAGDHVPSPGASVALCPQGFVALSPPPCSIYCWLLEVGVTAPVQVFAYPHLPASLRRSCC